MSEFSKIEWTNGTFNSHWGCTEISPGCDNCYARSFAARFGVKWGPGAARREFGEKHWAEPLKWDRKATATGTRLKVFSNSMSDIFDNEAPAGVRERWFALTKATPNIDWLLLTKRIGNVKNMLPADWGDGYPNVWIGASMVNQTELDRDMAKLLAIPAIKHFLSLEPLLAAVSFRWAKWVDHQEMLRQFGKVSELDGLRGIDWVITGGESGPKARPPHPDNFRTVRDQCVTAGVPFLLKQWGEWYTAAFNGSTGEPVFRQFSNFQEWVNKAQTWVQGGICLDRHGRELKNGGDMMQARDAGNFPVTIMHKVGKKAAGRILDGRTWDEVPA